MLNPVLLAVHHKSLSCLKYLLTTHKSLRQCMKGPLPEYVVPFDEEEATFDNLIFPLLINNKSNDMLAYLLKQDGFIFTVQDMTAFAQLAIANNWIAGLKNILWSHAAHITFSSIPFEKQTEFVDFLTLNREPSYIKQIVEETLSKRPYSKHLVLAISKKEERLPDQVKLTNYCLKTLVAEDFFLLHENKKDEMEQLKRKFEGDMGQEMLKIIKRYKNEGIPDDQKGLKQVRFSHEHQVQEAQQEEVKEPVQEEGKEQELLLKEEEPKEAPEEEAKEEAKEEEPKEETKEELKEEVDQKLEEPAGAKPAEGEGAQA